MAGDQAPYDWDLDGPPPQICELCGGFHRPQAAECPAWAADSFLFVLASLVIVGGTVAIVAFLIFVAT